MNILVQPIEAFFEFIRTSIEIMIPNPNISYGLAIIVLTIIVRLLLLPLTLKQTKSMSKMTEIQPELKKLQDKYKNDPQRLNQETMKLYKENGANPMSGCLPLLIQMPIIIALFTVFRELQGIENVGFVLTPWIESLALPDPYFILPVMSAILTFLSMKLSSAGTGNAQMGTMNIVMTAFILYVSLKFSAALLLYWVINNLIQLLQTFIIKKMKKSEPTKA
ncbi:membrane protein insertase YidC [Oceanirhabdus seepicola]|uniref:Membrane protein insertase YidC n=1 Tax=Oceanirhabdus seepicola TaxID=2828781 RepID=A0A9J6P689_9CLOT|nr:membrane protein insertase YidC [Oceanirhabdus seepicola]MCM1992354.1 membrane protein insertase YidC [Oceanirhabdus seepicola]